MSLVVDQDEGLTIKFKSDPLESVTVSSSFDNVENIKKFLQAQIEGQLRDLFSNELPQIIHQLSVEFIQRAKEPVSISPNGSSFTYSESDYLLSPQSMQMETGAPYYYDSPLLTLEPRYTSHSSYTQQHHSRKHSDGRLSRSHSQKWMGNEPVNNGYDSEPDSPRVLTRGLGSHEEVDGLGRLGDPSRDLNYGSQVLSRESLQHTRSAPDLPGAVLSSGSASISSTSNRTQQQRRRKLVGSGFRRLRIAGDTNFGASRSSVTGTSTYSAPNLSMMARGDRDPNAYHHHHISNNNTASSPIRPSHISLSSYNHHPTRSVDDEDWIIPQDRRSSVDVHPSDSTVSAHLASLMTSNRTLSVLTTTRGPSFPHTVLRADPNARAAVSSQPGSLQTSPTKQSVVTGTGENGSASNGGRQIYRRKRMKERSPLQSSASSLTSASGPTHTSSSSSAAR